MGKRKKPSRIKIRRKWPINPRERIAESGKAYKRQKEKSVRDPDIIE